MADPATRPPVSLGRLALESLLLGATGFGGYLQLQMQRRFVDRLGWLEEEEFTDAVTLAAIAPGGTSSALIVEIGRRLGGVRGAAIATIALLLPGTTAAIALLSLYEAHRGDGWVAGLIEGAAAGGVAVLCTFLVQFWKLTGRSVADVVGAVVIVALAVLGVPVPVVLVVGAIGGYVAVRLGSWRESR